MTVWLPMLIPATVGIVTFALGETRDAARNVVNLAGAAISAVIVVLLAVGAYAGEVASSAIPMLPGISLGMHADLTGMLFSAVASILWFVTLIYTIGYMDHARDRARFFGFFALCIAAANGVALASDPISLFLFYEILSLTTYPLVVHSGTAEARAAGRKYLVYALSGGTALLLGVSWLTVLAGQTPFTPGGALADVASHTGALRAIFALMVAGFGVKAALMPLHGWLPGAMVAPAPVSSLLHAVAVVKAGVFGMIRLVNELYGPGLATALGVAQVLSVLAAISIIVASTIALRQDDLKRRLAYSTIAQLSYITLGVALCSPLAAAGALAHLAHHAFMKITMFFTAGSLAETVHVKKLSQLGGVARRMPITMSSFAIAAFALAGIPPFAGFASKWLLGAGAVESGSSWALIVYVAAGALAMGYMVPILSASLRTGDLGSPNGLESDPRMLWPIVLVAAMSIVLGLAAGVPGSPTHWALSAVLPSFGGVMP
ncbi:MAG: monovalent cation/H+ antiporter subunit D family protein [Coriobacteriia bacterium]|nr:monovalent cation/H+ antiporter subunit D family protein [Coriobacteriia bacterium]